MMRTAPCRVAVSRLELRPVIHQRIVPSPGIAPVEALRHQRQQLRIADSRPAAKEFMDKHRPDVRLDIDHGAIIGIGADCRRRRRTDARQGHQLFRRRRQDAVSGRHLLRQPVQQQRPAIVPKPLPALQHPGERGTRQRRQRGKCRQEQRILFPHPRHLRLLQHDFRNEDTVRVGRGAPRQIARLPAIVGQHPPAKRR